MERTSLFGVLNVVAQPHVEGTYRRVYEGAARKAAKFWGDDFAAISPISATKDGIFTGRIAIWTELDRDGNVINKEEMIEYSFDESGVSIPSNLGLNSKIFQFAFDENKHWMYFEMRNDEGQNLSPRRAATAMRKIFSKTLPEYIDELDVHIVPEVDAVKKVLGLRSIRRIEIRLKSPNPDDLDEETASVLHDLESQGAKSQDLTLVKMAGAPSIVLSARNLILAKVSALNGFIWARGVDEGGDIVERSTRDHPRVLSRTSDSDTTPVSQIREVARSNRRNE